MPVYNLLDGEFTGELCDLDPANFNLPLRRDIVSKVFHYFRVKGVKLTKLVKSQGDVAGSGKKPFPQKGRGKARVGNKRAPQRKGGGKAHGPVPRDLTERINGKLRIKALQTMLSAKLYEDRIVLIDSEAIDFHKTKYLHELLKPYVNDRLTFLTGFTQDENFLLAAGNLPNISVQNPQEFHVPQMLRSDLIFMTKAGLQQLEEIIAGRHANLYRNRKIPLPEELPYKRYIGSYRPKRWQDPAYEEIVKPTLEHYEQFEPSEEEQQLELFTPSIAKYLEDLKQM